MKQTTIEISNIGGLAGTHKFTLKQGLNTIRAGNAVGKTSFQKSIELLSAKNHDLKGSKHYANLFGDGVAQIKATGDVQCGRKFRVNGDDLLEAGGEPIIQTGKGYVSGICFATPENPLINKMLEGHSIKSFVERFSDSEHYDLAIDTLKEISQTLAMKLSSYQETIAKIEETAKNIELLNKDKLDMEDKLNKMPKVDKQKAMKDEKAFQKAQEEKSIIRNKLSESKASINSTNNNIEDLNQEIEYSKTELQSIEKKNPQLEKRLTQLATEIPDKEDIIDKQSREVEQLEEKLRLAQENKTSRTKFAKENGNVCYACGKPLTVEEVQKHIDSIENKLDASRKAMKTVERETIDLKEEKEELEKKSQQAGKLKDLIEEKVATLSDAERLAVRLEKEIEQLKSDVEKIEKKIKDMSKDTKEFEKYQERDRLETLITEKEKTIKQAETRLKDLKSNIVDVDAIQNKKDFTDKAISHMRTRREEVVDAVRVKFNKIINDLYQNMGFKNIEEIIITRDYAVTMTKKNGGKEVENFPLEALSASERVTLGVALLMVAKQEYLPNFPFFVIDEIVTSYDPNRFEKIKNFVKGITDYVIVTELSSEDGIVIKHAV